MDFINFWPYGINELVFQHLTPKELIAAMLVSTEWNHFIGRSNAFSKICLVFADEIHQKKDLKLLKESQRKYRHLKARGTSGKDIIELISNTCFKFTTIRLKQMEFEEERNLKILMMNSCASLQKLELINLTLKNYECDDDTTISYRFPKLQDLVLAYLPECPYPYANKYFNSFQVLKKLTLINGSDENFKNLIRKSNLSKLVLEGCFQDTNFFKDLTTLRSTLDEFVFNNILSSSREDENLSYFNLFFESQGRTLKRFSTDALIEPDEIANAFKMPNLTDLQIRGFHYNHDLIQNTLENLKLNSAPLSPSSLNRVVVDYMDNMLFELLAIRAPNIKELIVRQFEVDDDEIITNKCYFQKLETFKTEYLNDGLKDRIKRKSETERTTVEKLIANNY